MDWRSVINNPDISLNEALLAFYTWCDDCCFDYDNSCSGQRREKCQKMKEAMLKRAYERSKENDRRT